MFYHLKITPAIFSPDVEIRDYNIILDAENLFDQTIKNYLRICDSIRKVQLVKEMITRLGTTLSLHFLSNMIGDSNDEANFPHKLLTTDG